MNSSNSFTQKSLRFSQYIIHEITLKIKGKLKTGGSVNTCVEVEIHKIIYLKKNYKH